MTCPSDANLEQSIRARGAWLRKHESALKACQTYLVAAFWTTYKEENTADLDQFLCEIEDHIELLSDTIADLRSQEFWPEVSSVEDEDEDSAEAAASE